MATDSPPSLNSAAAEQLAPHGRDVTIPARESPSSALLIKSEAKEDPGAGNLNFRGIQGPQMVSSEAAVASDNKLVIDEGNHTGNDLMKSESAEKMGRGEQSAPKSNKLESPFAEKEEKAKGEEGVEGEEDERLEVS